MKDIVFTILALFLGYLAIGGFVCGLINGRDLGPDWTIILFWPLLIITVVLSVVGSIPYKLGQLIRSFFNDW